MKRRLILLFTATLIFSIVCSAQYKTGIAKETYIYSIKDKDTLRLDKYDLTSLTHTKPCIIFVFGGGFISGNRDKDHYLPYFHNLAKEGYTVVSIDYRLGFKKAVEENKRIEKETGKKNMISPLDALGIFQNTISMAVEDLYDATNFILDHSAKWNIDKSRIVASGSSAGAITVLQGEYERCNKSSLSKKLPQGFRYAGVIAFAGAILSTEGDLTWKNRPAPIQMFHGDADANVPYYAVTIPNIPIGFYGSKYIAGKLHEIKAPYYFYNVENARHEIASTPMKDNLEEIKTFLHKFVLSRQNLIINTNIQQPDKPALNKQFGIEDYIRANGLAF